MHPEEASFLASHLLGERPAFETLRRSAPDIYFWKFNETTKRARTITNATDRHLARRNPCSMLSVPRGDN